jgi:hypothetical protein
MHRRTADRVLLALLPAAGPLTRQGAQDAARHELAKPPYQQAQPPIWERPLHWVLRKVASLWDHAAQATGGNAALLVLVLFFLVVVGLVLWRVGPMRRNAARGDLTFDLEGDKSAADHRAAADAFAVTGQWAEAVRERLRAISRDLEERVLVDSRPGRTAYELAAEGGLALPGSAALLREAAESFVAIWYGSGRATAEGYRRLVEIDTAVGRDRPARAAVPS